MAKVSAIILAAGTSSRMGETNKLFLDFQGKAIIQRVIENVLDSSADEVVVVGSKLSITQLTAFNYKAIRLVENKDYRLGMTSSIQQGVVASNSNTEGFMICLGDQPTIESRIYSLLIDTFEISHENKKSIMVPTHNRKQGNPIVFSSHYKQEIMTHEAPEGCKEILQRNHSFVKRIDVKSSSILRDVDTKEDYESL